MQFQAKIRNIVITIICYLYAFLFTYAAISKLIEFDKFQIQVGQSPLLSSFADVVTIAIPLIELIIVVMLFVPRLRTTALFSSYVLMVMFTSYIFLILNYSSYVPCSCGGVLQKLGWTEHLIFNIVFVVLAVVAIMLSGFENNNWLNRMQPLKFTCTIIGSAIISFLFILGLYLLSENLVHQRNGFVRRFDSHAKPEDRVLDLKVNSYYFAGISNGQLFLGNSTAPLVMTVTDRSFREPIIKHIKLDNLDFRFNSLQVRVRKGTFFVTDGTVPVIYKGNISDWFAKQQHATVPRFTLAEPIDSVTLAIRITSPSAAANILGTLSLPPNPKLEVNQNLLKKQKDGIFDTDGMLLINDQSKLNYIYYYRNQYLTIGTNLNLEKSGRTIDTITQSQIKVSSSRDGSEMSMPPVVVNKVAATSKNLLFVQSTRIGKFEDKQMLKHASVVDIYDLNTSNYISSIYVYDIHSEKMTAFIVNGTTLYALSGRYLSAIKLDKNITKHYQEK